MSEQIQELLAECAGYGSINPEYWSKMMHKIPVAKTVKREQFILERCKGKRVINFGSTSGFLHGGIEAVASRAFGVDKAGDPDYKIDLDDEYLSFFLLPISDVYVAGEILEHLSNPGSFLRQVKVVMNREPSELIITVPNAFGEAGRQWMRKGIEQVNADHTCWFSYHTLKVLVGRIGFKIVDFMWYGEGKPGFNEGLIFVVS